MVGKRDVAGLQLPAHLSRIDLAEYLDIIISGIDVINFVLQYSYQGEKMEGTSETRTTTIRLPRPVYEQAKAVVEKAKAGSGAAVSLNDFFVSAIKAYLKLYRRRQIDAAFAGMAEDAEYQKEAALIAAEFEHSDWEALRLEEQHLEGGPADDASSAR